MDDVRAGAVDLALVGVAGAEPAGLHSFTVVRERLVAAVPRNHPLAQLSSVTLADVCAHPLVTLPPGTGIRTVLDRGVRI